METNNIKITPKWSESKDEIWDKVFADLVESKTESKVRKLSWVRYVAAALIALVTIGSSFAYMYTTTEIVARGAHLAVTLPDGSNVNMNAESELSYKPFWWFVSRNVVLKGEAYFDVKSGSTFTVISNQSEVSVLGTSFNVFARADKYRVFCLTGKVEVAANNKKAILTPYMQANLRADKLEVIENSDLLQSIGWTQNKFSFIGVPLPDVIDEIERQYDIHVNTSSKMNYLYTGNFSKEKLPEEVLEIVGKPFGITFNIEM